MSSSDDMDQLFDAADQFWRDYSRLVNDALRKVPRAHRGRLEMMLQERSNVYSREYDESLDRE